MCDVQVADYLLGISDQIAQFNRNKLLVVGDFNLPGIDWDRVMSGAGSVLDANVLFDMMLDHKLVQVVREPTRLGNGLVRSLTLSFFNAPFPIILYLWDLGCLNMNLLLHRSRWMVLVLTCMTRIRLRLWKNFAQAADVWITDHLDSCLSEFCQNDVLQLWENFKIMCLFCIDQFIPNKRKKPVNITMDE